MPNTNSPRTIRIGLAGLGNVGAGVFKNVAANRDLILQRTGADLQIGKVAVRDLKKKRDVAVPAAILTGDWRDIIADASIQVVVEHTFRRPQNDPRVSTRSLTLRRKCFQNCNRVTLPCLMTSLFGTACTPELPTC